LGIYRHSALMDTPGPVPGLMQRGCGKYQVIVYLIGFKGYPFG